MSAAPSRAGEIACFPPLNGEKMDTSGIEPDPSRTFPEEMLSERDNQLHHVPLQGFSFFYIWTFYTPASQRVFFGCAS